MGRFSGLAACIAALAWMTLSSDGVMARGAVCPSVTIIPPTGLSFNRPGGTGLIRVFAPIPDCTWTATSSAPWVTFPDGATGAGIAWLRYLVAAAPPSADNRTATVTISGGNAETYQVFQSGRITGDTGWMQSPVGWNASPSTAAIAQPFVVSGYAIDDRATSGTGVSSVQIFYVGNTGFHPLGTALYGASRPHIGETHGSQFENSGYELTVTGIPPLGTAPTASYSIQAFGVSSVDGLQFGAGATRVSIIDPAFAAAPGTLAFGAATAGATVTAVTPPQAITLSGFGWTVGWTASADQPWMLLSRSSGTGPGRLDVAIDSTHPAFPSSGVLLGSVRVDAPGVPGAPIDIPVRVDVYQGTTTAPPNGAFDPPPSFASGAVPLTGWALDDVGVAGVSIYRPSTPQEGGTGLVFVGEGTFVDGARPDVAAAFPQAPQKTRAGWGLMLLSNALPGGGNGTFTFYAFARDAEGKQTLLGARATTSNNAGSTLPFGALDAPAPGATVSGVSTFAGWVLAPFPASVLSVGVFVDGQRIGAAQYGTARPDVAALFAGPTGPPDANAAGLRFTMDTRQFANGLHTIALVALANDGSVTGLASRYFIVHNP